MCVSKRTFEQQESTNLAADESTDSLLSGACGLVPRTLGAIRAVLSDGTRAREGGTGELGGSVGSLVLGLSLLLLGLALGLVASAAGEVTNGVLDGAGGGVDVGLEGGGVVVGHFDWCEGVDGFGCWADGLLRLKKA